MGGAHPGRKVCTLVAAMLVGASHIDHVDRLRAGSTDRVLPHAVMAPSTVGTFLRSFTWGHVRQLEKVGTVALGRAWGAGAGPGKGAVTLDVDSTICEVSAKTKQGAAYRLHQRVGLSPSVGVPSRYGGGGRCPSAGRSIAEGCGPFRWGDSAACATGRGQGPGERAGRFGVLVLYPLGRPRPPRGGLVDHLPR